MGSSATAALHVLLVEKRLKDGKALVGHLAGFGVHAAETEPGEVEAVVVGGLGWVNVKEAAVVAAEDKQVAFEAWCFFLGSVQHGRSERALALTHLRRP